LLPNGVASKRVSKFYTRPGTTTLIALQINILIMNNLHKFFLTTLCLMGLTIFHHFYASIIYPQAFRAHVAYVSIPVVVLEYIIYREYRKATNPLKKRLHYILFQILAWSVPILLIGFYEGGYNHFLKNILFFAGVKLNILTDLFPPPMYEMPNNFIFEFTGILQFVTAIYALLFLLRHYKEQNIVRSNGLRHISLNTN